MNKGLAVTGGVLTGISILSLLFGIISIAGHGPDSANILHDTEFDGRTFAYDGDVVLLEVYAKGDVDCYSFSISISDDFADDYFYANCETGSDINGYTYLGDIEFIPSGSYSIDAEGDVVIIDADGLLAPVFVACGGGVCCLIGIILLIVGLVVGKKAPQVIVYQQPDGSVYQPNQTTVQQYVPPSIEEQPIQQQQNIPPAFEENPNAVPVYQTDFDGFSFEHKKED